VEAFGTATRQGEGLIGLFVAVSHEARDDKTQLATIPISHKTGCPRPPWYGHRVYSGLACWLGSSYPQHQAMRKPILFDTVCGTFLGMPFIEEPGKYAWDICMHVCALVVHCPIQRRGVCCGLAAVGQGCLQWFLTQTVLARSDMPLGVRTALHYAQPQVAWLLVQCRRRSKCCGPYGRPAPSTRLLIKHSAARACADSHPVLATNWHM
jgi:hypothetical protein